MQLLTAPQGFALSGLGTLRVSAREQEPQFLVISAKEFAQPIL